MKIKNTKVEEFLKKTSKWQEEFTKLRMIILDFELTEEFKWGVPCYAYLDKNIVLMHGFKEYCALLFIKGSLMLDKSRILIQQTEHVQAARQIRFKNIDEIIELEETIKEYIKEAIEIEKSGLKVDFVKKTELVYPMEFQKKLEEMPDLEIAFDKLTPGRRRAYNIYFSAPKQSKTRDLRIEKSVQMILEGKGLNDNYKK